MERPKIVFYCMADSPSGLAEVHLFIESLRLFGGSYSECPVHIFLMSGVEVSADGVFPGGCTFSPIPEVAPDCRPYFFADKVYCAAEAEAMSRREGSLLVWVDNDTLILNEPSGCRLEAGRVATLCPVMHNRTGVAWGEHPGEMWEYLDSLFEINKDTLFPVVAPADGVKIRPYFNAGLMVIDPRKEMMRMWKEHFITLCGNPEILDIVARRPDDRIFLHQTVLTEVFLKEAGREAITILPATYNYPLFFQEMFPAIQPFNDLSEAVTARYDIYFRNPRPGWQDRLKGPGDKIEWLTGRLEALKG